MSIELKINEKELHLMLGEAFNKGYALGFNGILEALKIVKDKRNVDDYFDSPGEFYQFFIRVLEDYKDTI